jgi:hypothetical protein
MAVKSPGFTAPTPAAPAAQLMTSPDVSAADTALQLSRGEIEFLAAARLDAHAQECAQCQAALDVPSPDAACVTRLCGDGLALLGAALSPFGTLAVQQVTQVAS